MTWYNWFWNIFSDISIVLMVLITLYSIINQIIKPSTSNLATNQENANLVDEYDI